VDYDQFIAKVAQRAGTSREDAEALARATLETLAERITGGEAQDLAAQLPKPLKDAVPQRPPGTAEAFDLHEFERRVARRAGVPEDQVEPGIRAVFQTLGEAVTHGEFEDVLAQLPREFRPLASATA
jgi:uncharacterized protein (DUF2267 family)